MHTEKSLCTWTAQHKGQQSCETLKDSLAVADSSTACTQLKGARSHAGCHATSCYACAAIFRRTTDKAEKVLQAPHCGDTCCSFKTARQPPSPYGFSKSESMRNVMSETMPISPKLPLMTGQRGCEEV